MYLFLQYPTIFTCADIKFEIDEVSKTDSDKSSHHNVAHTENNQKNLLKNTFFRLDPNWGKNKAVPYSFEKVLSSTQFSNMTITDECSVPLTDNSTHQHIQLNMSLESPMESKTIQCDL